MAERRPKIKDWRSKMQHGRQKIEESKEESKGQKEKAEIWSKKTDKEDGGQMRKLEDSKKKVKDKRLEK